MVKQTVGMGHSRPRIVSDEVARSWTRAAAANCRRAAPAHMCRSSLYVRDLGVWSSTAQGSGLSDTPNLQMVGASNLRKRNAVGRVPGCIGHVGQRAV